MMRRTFAAGIALLVGSVVLSGCDFDVYKLPLPGGTDVGDDPMTITVEFRDVLDLVPQSTVKVNEVSVGKVTDVELDGYTALVTIELRRGHRAARQRGRGDPPDQPAGREVRLDLASDRGRERRPARRRRHRSRSSEPAAIPRSRRSWAP